METGGDKYGRDLGEQIRSRVHDRMTNRDRYSGLIPGAVILAIGVIFLLNNLGYVRAGRFWQFWPLLLIFAGLVKLSVPSRRAWGAILLVFGILLQLNQLGYAHFSWGAMWPMVLIAAGAFAMWSALQARKMIDGFNGNNADPRTTLNESAIFGGVQKRLNAKEFRGGQLQSLFGGIEIDLRDADLAETEAVVRECNFWRDRDTRSRNMVCRGAGPGNFWWLHGFDPLHGAGRPGQAEEDSDRDGHGDIWRSGDPQLRLR